MDHPATVALPASLAAWGSPDFAATLKREIEGLGAGRLPLQQALRATSIALDGPIEVMVLGAAAREPGSIRARVGVFFSGIVAGCSCADDPTPVEAQPEFCELTVAINDATAQAAFALVGN